MKGKGVVLVPKGKDMGDPKQRMLYKVKRTFNLLNPLVGAVLSTSEVERLNGNPEIVVTIQDK